MAITDFKEIAYYIYFIKRGNDNNVMCMCKNNILNCFNQFPHASSDSEASI